MNSDDDRGRRPSGLPDFFQASHYIRIFERGHQENLLTSVLDRGSKVMPRAVDHDETVMELLRSPNRQSSILLVELVGSQPQLLGNLACEDLDCDVRLLGNQREDILID